MKSLVIAVLLLLPFGVHAQKYEFLQPISIDIVEPSITNELDTNTIKPIDIKAEYWISTVYNPYKYAGDLKFPLKLSILKSYN